MNPTIVTARVSDQRLQLVNEPLIASGGVDVVQIKFEFCGLWTGCGKTAVFYRNKDEIYHVPITLNCVTVPWEVLTEGGYFYFGVFGVASNVRPTEVVKIRVAQGAITTATIEPQEPTPDIYEQLVRSYGILDTRVQEVLAMHSTGGVASFEFTGSTVSGTLVGNGATAGARVQINNVTMKPGDVFYSDYCVPKEWTPLLEKIPLTTNHDSILGYIERGEGEQEDSARFVLWRVDNDTTNIKVTVTLEDCYPLRYPSLPELVDIRTGYDGTVYPLAGDAVREQIVYASQNGGGGGAVEQFEEIETIKVDGAGGIAIREIARGTDKNGKPLALKRLLVKIQSSAGTGQGLVTIRTYNNNVQIGVASITAAINTGVRYSYASFYPDCGYWSGHTATPVSADSSPGAMAGMSFANTLAWPLDSYPHITIFKITANVDFPVGTEIKVYGVWA